MYVHRDNRENSQYGFKDSPNGYFHLNFATSKIHDRYNFKFYQKEKTVFRVV